MSFDQDGRMMADYDKSERDFLRRYGRTPDEVMAENAKLRERVAELEGLTDGKRYIPQEWYQLATSENAKLRALMARMAEALGIDCEWADPNWCKSPCVLEFGCWPNDEHAEIRCPAWAAMRELGVDE